MRTWSLTEACRSSFRRPDQVSACLGERRGGGEGDRAERVHRHSDYRGVAETQPRERRRALQGRKSRGPARLAAGSQLTVVRERRRQRWIKVRAYTLAQSAKAKLSEIFHLSLLNVANTVRLVTDDTIVEETIALREEPIFFLFPSSIFSESSSISRV